MTTTVQLDLRNHASNGSDGYTTTTASNGNPYSYRYTGGSDGAGGVTATVHPNPNNPVSFDVSIAATESRYRIREVTLTDPAAPSNPQLSASIASDQRSATITDIDSAEEAGAYCIRILDDDANCSFDCDPPITNQPE